MDRILALFHKDKRLGSAAGRQYDIPLNKNTGTDFLVLLIALMTFLAVMALSGSFALGSMARSWSSGLENKLTIEIPAEKSDGTLRTQEQIDEFTQKILEKLNGNPRIKSLVVLEEEDIKELISPWLGSDMVLDDIPLPGLISAELHISTPEIISDLEQEMALINNNIRIDTHETWLASLLRVTGALQFSGALITIIIAITAVLAVAGGIRARMAIHREDVELLHLMGASDDYITRQFQRHALILALKGAVAGGLAGLGTLFFIGSLTGDTGEVLLPGASLKALHILALITLPALACLIAALAARFTVLRVLAMMP